MADVGVVIRMMRTQRGMTLRALADKVGISVPYLSQIESGRANININLLENIGHALNVPLYLFFLSDMVHDISHVKRDSRSRMVREDGVVIEQLVDQEHFKDNIVIMEFPPAYTVEEYSSHEGNEFVFILQGSAQIEFSKYQIYTLEEGDSLTFPSSIPHRITSTSGGRLLIRSGTYHRTFF